MGTSGLRVKTAVLGGAPVATESDRAGSQPARSCSASAHALVNLSWIVAACLCKMTIVYFPCGLPVFLPCGRLSLVFIVLDPANQQGLPVLVSDVAV